MSKSKEKIKQLPTPKEKSKPRLPSQEEVNKLYQRTQKLAQEYDFAHDCIGGVNDELIEELASAYQEFIDAVNLRRADQGKPPYKDINDLPVFSQ